MCQTCRGITWLSKHHWQRQQAISPGTTLTVHTSKQGPALLSWPGNMVRGMTANCAVLCCAVQLQGYLSQPRTISSHHFGSGLLKGEVLPANSRLVSNTGRQHRAMHVWELQTAVSCLWQHQHQHDNSNRAAKDLESLKAAGH